MNFFKKHIQIAEYNDSALVMASQGGDRTAFCEIVTRYQNLLCSLAYSSVGDLKHSEDIAQETFIEAWKNLDTLRDPEKLKSWLCGILRFKVSHFRRKEMSLPINDADEIDDQIGGISEYSKIEDEAISAQEQALLWQALGRLPETYREPLILFYRENHSVEQVATQLDLSVDTAKQRLSRGRKLLQEAMTTFIEQTLVKSRQGAKFTVSVMAIINDMSPNTKTLILGAGTLKTGSLVKWATILISLASLSGLISSFFGLRSGLDQSRTPRERRRVIFYAASYFAIALFYIAGMFSLKHLAGSDVNNVGLYTVIAHSVAAGFVASYIFLVARMLKGLRRLRAEERLFHPEAFLGEKDQKNAPEREYKSSVHLAGIPIVHFRFGSPEQGDKPVVGWLAGGDIAYGLLFAWGGVAMAPISVGIVSLGMISVGAVSFGLMGIGTIGIGIIGFGASAIGYKAYGTFSSLGWDSAFTGIGFSIAKHAAIGPFSYARHVNNEVAAKICALNFMEQSYLWILAAITLLVIIPSAWHSAKVRQRMKQ